MPANQIRETLDDTSRLRLSNRLLLVGLTVGLVLGAAVLTAQFAADQVKDTAVNEGAQSAQSIVRSIVGGTGCRLVRPYDGGVTGLPHGE